MDFRQRLLAMLNGQRPDVMPWFADLSYWYNGQEFYGTLPPEYEGDAGYIQLHADYHCGYYLGPLWWATTNEYDNVEVSSDQQDDVTTTRWQTPVGEIWGQTKFSPISVSEAQVKWAVATPDDLRVLQYIADATQPTSNEPEFVRLKKLAGGRGHPTILPPRSPLSKMLWEWSGVTNFAYLEADHPEEVKRTLAALGRAADAAYEFLLGWDTPFIELGDNLTGEITPWFERYQFDYYVRRLEPLHSVGKKVGVHLDGTLRGILPLLVETGLDYIEAITPLPVGDVAVADLRQMAGPDIILFGGIPGAMFAAPFTSDDMRRQVELVIEHHWESNKFIMGVADQVPPDGDIDLVRLVGELVEELCS